MKRSTKILTVAAVALGIAAVAGTSIASSEWRGNHQGYHSGGHQMGMQHRMGGGMGRGMGMGRGYNSQMMDRFDANDDGKVSIEEMAAVRDKALADHDANKDGKLSLDEFQGVWLEHMRDRMVRHFQHLDTDGNAQITKDEMEKITDRMMSMMSRMGRDNDDDDDDDKRRGPMGKRK